MDHPANEQEKSQYLIMWERYQQMGSGAKADIRRVAEPKELLSVGAFYRLCGQETHLIGYANVVYLLPWLGHEKQTTLGEILYRDPSRRISEARMIQMQRAEYPQDIVALRRLVWQAAGRHAEKSVDWDVVGPQLYYWGNMNKLKIIQDYYIAEIRTNIIEEE